MNEKVDGANWISFKKIEKNETIFNYFFQEINLISCMFCLLK